MESLIKKAIILFVVLCSLMFFRLLAIGESGIKGVQVLGVLAILGVIYFQLFFDKSARLKKHFTWEVIILLVAVLFSMITPWREYGQSIKTTLIAQRQLYFVLFYFMLHLVKPSHKEVQQIFVVVGILYGICSLLQYFAYPTMIFDVRASIDRGTIRIFFPGNIFAVVTFLLALHFFFQQYKAKYILIMMFIASVFILQGTRQTLASVAFASFLFILFNQKIKSKLLIMVLVGFSLIPLYFAFESIFSEMLNVTESQSERFEDNVRVRAATFFLTYFKHDTWGYILGSGMDSQKNIYGLLVDSYKENLGFYIEDIGIVGEFVRYGVLFVLAQVLIIIKVFRSRIPNHLLYIKVYFAILILTLFTGAGYFTFSFTGIALLLYQIDLAKTEKLLSNTYE
jgi:hypothetical protein